MQQRKTTEVSSLISNQLSASFNQTLPYLPKSFVEAISRVLAGVFILCYKYVDFVFLQIFIKYATNDEVTIAGRTFRPLTEWGNLIGEAPIDPATQSILSLVVDVYDLGSSLEAGTQLLHAQTGLTFVTVDSIVLSETPYTFNVRAAADQNGGNGSGTIGNLADGSELSFATPFSFINRIATVAATVESGVDAETVDDYRTRIINRFQRRPQGGAYADYDLWGKDAGNIANIYPYRGSPGEVDVYVEDKYSVDGIPDAATLLAVYDAIQKDSDGKANRRPVGARVNTLPITRTGFNIQVVGISEVSDLGQVQTDIADAMNAFMLAREPYIDGLTIPPRKDKIPKSALIGIVEDIVTAANGVFDTVHYQTIITPIDLDIYVLGTGEKAKVSLLEFT